MVDLRSLEPQVWCWEAPDCERSYMRVSANRIRPCTFKADGVTCKAATAYTCPLQSPALPPPSPPPLPIPADGISIVEGRGPLVSVRCLRPGDEAVTTAPFGRLTIATQCCTTSGECRRYIGTKDDRGCMAGLSSPGNGAPFIDALTYGEAVGRCSSLGLVLCAHCTKQL